MTLTLSKPMAKPAELEDQNLINRFKNPLTQEDAFRQIVGKYQERVYGLVRKMVISHDDADDVMQEVFVKVWKGLSKFREDAQLFTWIYRIATNESINFLNKKKRRAFFSIRGDDLGLERQIEADMQISGDSVQLLLQKAIIRLPEKQRLVFHMRYYDEMKYKDMSEVLGTSEGALKASYHIAAKKNRRVRSKS